MKVRKWLSLLLIVLLLAGCGAKSEFADSAENYSAGAAAQDMVQETIAGNTNAAEGRKWIATVDMSVETEDLDAMLDQLSERITELSGYVEHQNVHNGSTYSERRYRSASMTVRIPVAQLDQFTEQVDGISNVVSKSQSLDDVTLTYTATESRLKALQAEETRLLELMEQAGDLSDLLQIERRLTEVQSELEQTTSQLRVLDNQVDYATIHLDIEEVQIFTKTEEETAWQRISGGFVDSLKGIGNGALELLIWILANLPYLVLLGGIGTAVVLIVKKKRKK